MEQLNREEANTIFEKKEPYILYLYTPMCGTCQVAEKMLSIVEEVLPEQPIGKTDINYIPELAEFLEIESVPCLLLLKDGAVASKTYAFRSVPDLMQKISQLNR